MNPLFEALSRPYTSPSLPGESPSLLSTAVGAGSKLLLALPKTLLATVILPAITLTKKEVAQLSAEANRQLKKLEGVQISALKIDQSHSLDRVIFSASNKPMHKRKILIYFLPNYQLWQEKVEEFDEFRQKLGCDIVSANYRGCGHSTSFPLDERHFIVDGCAQVKQLLLAGAKAEKIVLYGYSLGGGVALAVANKLNDEGITVHHVNERSFESIPAVIKTINVFGKEIGAEGVKALRWNFPSGDALKRIRGKVVIIYGVNDEVIPYPASLTHAYDTLQLENRDRITCIALAKTESEDQHNRFWTAREKRIIFAAISKLWS